VTQEVAVIEQHSTDAVAQANALAVKTDEQYALAAEFLKRIKGLQKEVGDTFDPIIVKANAAHKEAIGQRDKYLKPLQAAEKEVKGKIAAFVDERESIRREAEAKLRAEAERKQEDIRRKAAEAEAKGNAERAEKLVAKAEAVPRSAYRSKVRGWTERVRDPEDAPLFACADAIGAHGLVSGDRDVPVLKGKTSVRVLRTRDALDLIGD